MNQKYYLFEHKPVRPKRGEKLLISNKEILLPVSADDALERLKSAFASPVTISKGFFSPGLICKGDVFGSQIEMEFTIDHGRNSSHWKIQGCLFDDPRGSRLSISMVDQTPAWVYFSLLCLGIFIWADGSILSMIIPAIIICFIPVALALMNRNYAEESICRLLEEIILSGKPRASIGIPRRSYSSEPYAEIK